MSGSAEEIDVQRLESKQTPQANLIGSWKAPAAKGGTVDLSFAAAGSFDWTYSRPRKSQWFDGKYKLADTTLVLEYTNGASMVGKVSPEGENRFSFKMVGGPPKDPGLVFTR